MSRRPMFAAPLLSLLPALALAACEARPGEAAGTHDAPAAVSVAPAAGDFSVYALEDEAWRDQHGEVRTLASLAGRTQVMAMVYTNCYHTCPQIVADLKRVEAETADEDVGFVLVSLDPERDTPEQLHRFAEGLGLPPERWTLLTGAEGDTRALAALLSVRYRTEAEKEIAHTNQLTVLDSQGRIVHQRTRLDEVLDATIAAVRAGAAAGEGD